MTDIQTIIIPLLVISGLIYGVVMWIIRKIQAGEKFDMNKILQTLGIAAVAGVTLYVATGAIPSLDALLTQMATIVPNDPSLVGLGAIIFGLFEQYILKGKLGTTPIVVPVTTAPSDFQPSPAFPRGKASILGIYGHSAAGDAPKASTSFDVNQVPELFFDLQTLITGKVMLSMLIDGDPLKDWSENSDDLTKIGQKHPWAFWIPPKYRTVGNHIITIKMGYLAGAENITPGGSDSKTVWDTSQDFGLVFTGVKASE